MVEVEDEVAHAESAVARHRALRVQVAQHRPAQLEGQGLQVDAWKKGKGAEEDLLASSRKDGFNYSRASELALLPHLTTPPAASV